MGVLYLVFLLLAKAVAFIFFCIAGGYVLVLGKRGTGLYADFIFVGIVCFILLEMVR